MYTNFFGLRELPFNNTPDPRFFYSTPEHEEAVASMIYAVKGRKGFVLLTGEIGAGKTLASRMMLRHFGNSIAFANINHAVNGARELMESVCTELEITTPPGCCDTQLVRLLHDFLLERFAQNIPIVLVLDEAQNLPIEAFEQLRMIGNLEADDAKLLQICIVGQPELGTMFASHALRQLKQRLYRSFHLPALQESQTEAYIEHRLAVVGAQYRSIFHANAMPAIHEHARGLPRLINTICDNAMLVAYSLDQSRIDAAMIESVVKQMMCSETDERSGDAARPLVEADDDRPTALPRHSMVPRKAHPPRYGNGRTSPQRHAPASRRSRRVRASISGSAQQTELFESIRETLHRLQSQARAHETRSMPGRAFGRTAISNGGEMAALRGQLRSLVGRAEDLVARAEQASRFIQSRESELRYLSRSVEDAIESLRRESARLPRTAAADPGHPVPSPIRELPDRLASMLSGPRKSVDTLRELLQQARCQSTTGGTGTATAPATP